MYITTTGEILTRSFADRLRLLMGPQGLVEDEADLERYCVSFDGSFLGRTNLVARPSSTAEVAAVVAACAKARVPMVPQGGNTGLAGGAQPIASGSVIISLERMRALRSIDVANDTITVEAGMTLAEVQSRAAEMDRLFPLSLASEGSCQIGGNLSTNAGGTQVLRYGNTRALTLGLEAVLPDGRVWNGLRGLRKDSAGYDLKHLFIGAEGTLGIITAATLRTVPRPRDVATAFIALSDPESALHLLQRARGLLGDSLSGFELMRRECVKWVLVALPTEKPPFAEPHPWYALIEATAQSEPGGLRGPLEELLAVALEEGLLIDAMLADSESQRRRLWRLREGQAEAQKAGGAGIKHDVSVPVSRVPEFIKRADAALARAIPGIRPFAFGHLGDGNIHFNPMPPEGIATASFVTRREEVNRIVHDIVAELDGSISAEHGVGQLRTAEMTRYKSTIEREMMKTLKRAFDPNNLMNPGKVIV
ncbi:FAD-binding oxidoreductase [Bradyrhizobium sp. 197]|uniref:FAD-binding oxidoreductase n=1 Tax=Bradyrhizobium sp. 197 TaxID=2782663 RepID=UPI001FFB49F6|nr:FAD-binding oxidoreductase [Bradyrhizobium sp. 197]MCK1479484.1 FAD-binding oxidoreductase [Bradyrhizobium sp. 197]